MRNLISMPVAESFEFDQSEHGQIAKAPTRLLAIRLPRLKQLLRATPGKGRCSHPGGHVTLKGRAADGTWRTAAKKTYPESMCRAIAHAFVEQFDATLSNTVRERHLTGEDLDTVPELAPFCVAFDSYEAPNERAPDYAPEAATACLWD